MSKHFFSAIAITVALSGCSEYKVGDNSDGIRTNDTDIAPGTGNPTSPGTPGGFIWSDGTGTGAATGTGSGTGGTGPGTGTGTGGTGPGTGGTGPGTGGTGPGTGGTTGTGTGAGTGGTGPGTGGTGPGTGGTTGTGTGAGTGGTGPGTGGSGTGAGTGTGTGYYTVPTTGILLPGTWTGTLGTTADTSQWDTCDWADHVAGFLDPYQTPYDGRVLFCHGQNGNWTFVNASISACLTHSNHNNDIFPTSICDS